MYPHERSLVNRLQDKPFALLGIDTGDEPRDLQKLVRDGTVTWRFWLDPREHINRRYRIRGYPTLMLLDHRGVIRAVNLHNMEQIEGYIEALLKEAEADAGKTS